MCAFFLYQFRIQQKDNTLDRTDENILGSFFDFQHVVLHMSMFFEFLEAYL